MKRWWMMLMAACAVAAFGAEYPVKRLTPYPKEFKECYQGTLFRNDKGGERTPVLYGFLRFTPGTSAVQVSVTYRSTEATSLRFGMTFQRQGGRNESAGRGPAQARRSRLPLTRRDGGATSVFKPPPQRRSFVMPFFTA